MFEIDTDRFLMVFVKFFPHFTHHIDSYTAVYISCTMYRAAKYIYTHIYIHI